jgi:hypothetical protein
MELPTQKLSQGADLAASDSLPQSSLPRPVLDARGRSKGGNRLRGGSIPEAATGASNRKTKRSSGGRLLARSAGSFIGTLKWKLVGHELA